MNKFPTVTGYESDSSNSSSDTVVECASDHTDDFNASDHSISDASDYCGFEESENKFVSKQDFIPIKETAIDTEELKNNQSCDDNNNKVVGYLDLTITGRISLTSLDLDLVSKFLEFLQDGQIEARMFMDDIGESSTDTFEVGTGKLMSKPTADLKKVEKNKEPLTQQQPSNMESGAKYLSIPEQQRHLQYYNAIPEPQEPVVSNFHNGNYSSSEDTLSVGSAGSDSVETIPIRIQLPEQDIQKCLCLKPSQTVWFAKQHVISSVSQDVKDTLNYGFYQPPANGRAGKFLDEERLLRDYPMMGPVGYLEFKYKRRVYKQLNLDGNQIKKYNGRSYQKNMMDYIKSNSPDKVKKLIDKGLDPNFIDESSGETPMTLAVTVNKSEEVIKMLLLGGYHHDFRNRDGLTAVHKAVLKANARIIEVILDLGASPNYKDERGLTPLYYTAMHGGDPRVAEILLKDKATVNNVDSQGWSEIHQACRYGRVQHLEHLLFYGADIDAQNEAGNTGLHVAALNNHTPAARTLLFRGCNKQLKNKANQTAYQAAVIGNNTQLAAIIQDHAEDAVVMHRRLPQYTNRRRWTQNQGALTRATSEPLLQGSYSTLGRMGHRFPRQLSSTPLTDCISTASLDISDGPRSLRASPVTTHAPPAQNGGIRYVAIKNYKAFEAGELTLHKGDIVEVTNKDDESYWEGKVGNSYGLFPAYCVDKVVMRGKKVEPDTLSDCSSTSGGANYEHILKTVTIKRGKKGFGFVLRGAKTQSKNSTEQIYENSKNEMRFQPSSENPALQYLDSVDEGSNAEKAGLKPGDFLLEINGEDVRQAEHQRVVYIVSKCPDTLQIKVVTVEKTITPRTPSLDSHGSSKRKDEDNISIASDASSNSSQGSQKIASIRSRPTSKRVSSQHLDQILQRQGSKSSLLSASSNPNKPVIPATPIFRYGTMGRNPKGTGEVVDNTLPRRSSNGSDSAHSSLRSSPASSYSLATDSSYQSSTDSGVPMKMERSVSEHFTQYQSQPNAIPQRAPPAINSRSKSMISLETASTASTPEPKAKKTAPSPSPARALALREQKKRNNQTPSNPPPVFNPKTPPSKHKSVAKTPPAPPPPPPVEPPQNNNTVNEIAKQNKLTRDINSNGSLPVKRKSEPNTFAASIARAAEKRKEQENFSESPVQIGSNAQPSHAVQIALAARQRNMNQNNQLPNQEPSQSASLPTTGLQAEILQRKAKFNSNAQSNETIEEKIKRQKENNVHRPKSTHDALLEAIAKRKSRLDQKEMEANSSESQSRQNSFEAWNDPTPTKPVKVPPSVPPKRNPNTKLSESEGSLSRNGSPLLNANRHVNANKFGRNVNDQSSTPKQNGMDNTDSRNQSSLPPPPQFNATQRGNNVENTPNNFSSILNRFQNNSPTGTLNGHLANDMICVPPPPSNSENINQMVLEIVPPPPAMDINSRPQRLSRDHAFDTASVVSSVSSVSTLSNLSNEPWDSFQTIGEEDDKVSSLRSGSGNSQNSGSNRISNGPISTSFQASNSFQDKELSTWQPEDVADWLISLKLGEYRESFLENEISGEHLMALSKEDFTELGVTRIGHRLTIEKHLRKLRST
ncbi:SH3 and multiple ankyrin repeat domains protein 3-like isoform X3 [Anneissia japonica]|uniref:SH3 and multiple ankyrin repeat domains protein 3-like isoform X3 n=1 Tax=Anneissia japonica TaxID=1529436 RepID=UPI00142577A5|nr:SH3 and multiple ankyrin repeat domains protein 3-like isoform X3 [Anneissia japonica]